MNRKAIVIGLGVLLLAVVMWSWPHTPQVRQRPARIVGDKARAIELSGRELGLIYTNTESYPELIVRAKKNPQLKEAFLKTKSAGVGILPQSWVPFSVGYIGEGYVAVNTWCSDEDIIEFLTKSEFSRRLQ